MKLIDVVKSYNRRLAAPLISYPGMRLTQTNALQNLTDSNVQFETIRQITLHYPMDIVLPFIDLTVEAEALGIPVDFAEDDAPSVRVHPLMSADQLSQYEVPDPHKAGRMPVFLSVVRRFKQQLPHVVGGMTAGPFTLAGLMMGAETLAINTLLDADFCHKTIDFATEVVLEYAKALVGTGADFIVLLDPTAVLLSPELYDQFAGQYISRIVEELSVPVVIHTCGNTTNIVPNMCKTGAHGLSLDGVVNFPEIAKIVPDDVVLIGNVDPVRVMLNMTPQEVYAQTMQLLKDMEGVPNYILSTGCDLPPATPLDNVEAFCSAAGDYNEGVVLR